MRDAPAGAPVWLFSKLFKSTQDFTVYEAAGVSGVGPHLVLHSAASPGLPEA